MKTRLFILTLFACCGLFTIYSCEKEVFLPGHPTTKLSLEAAGQKPNNKVTLDDLLFNNNDVITDGNTFTVDIEYATDEFGDVIIIETIDEDDTNTEENGQEGTDVEDNPTYDDGGEEVDDTEGGIQSGSDTADNPTYDDGDEVTVGEESVGTGGTDVEDNPNIDDGYEDVTPTTATLEISVSSLITEGTDLYSLAEQKASIPRPCSSALPQAFAHYQQLANETCQAVYGCVYCWSSEGPVYICIAATPAIMCEQLEEF